MLFPDERLTPSHFGPEAPMEKVTLRLDYSVPLGSRVTRQRGNVLQRNN
jgi:hypothetical protein